MLPSRGLLDEAQTLQDIIFSVLIYDKKRFDPSFCIFDDLTENPASDDVTVLRVNNRKNKLSDGAREDRRTAPLPERRVVNVGVEVFVGEVQRPFLWHKESFSQ